MANINNNKKALLEGIKMLNTFDLALLRERIIMVAEHTIKEVENNPDGYKNGFVAPAQLIKSMNNIKEAFKFEKMPVSVKKNLDITLQKVV